MKISARNAVWYTLTLSGIVFTMTIITTIQGAPLWGWAIAIFLAILQMTGLIYYLHRNPDKEEKGLLKIFLILLKLSVLGVAFWLCLALYALASQYHDLVTPTSLSDHNNITIVQSDELYIMYPEYTEVKFNAGHRPSRWDEKITFCAGAAFQHSYRLSFSHDNIVGIHVEAGKLHEGYSQSGLGAFTFYDGDHHFANPENARDELETAAREGGYGFQQYMVIENGRIILKPADEYRCFRALAEIDGRLCIIDSRAQMNFEDYAEALISVGVENALYMDMGSGWNYSWIRNNDGSVKRLIGLPWPFSHNWISFVK